MAVRVQLVVNPDAGGYRVEHVLELREAFRRKGARVTLAHIGPGRQLMVEDDADLIVVAGGDGTLRHAAMALLTSGRDLPLACYPMGTVNLLHLEVGGPTQPDEFAHVALNQVKAQFHVPATINGDMFFGCASVGPDSRAVAGVSLRLKRWIGRYAYLVAMLRLLGRWMRMITIPNQSSVAMAYKEFDDAGRMKPSAYFDRVVDVMEELVKFTLLTRGVSGYLVDRYSERKEALSFKPSVL